MEGLTGEGRRTIEQFGENEIVFDCYANRTDSVGVRAPTAQTNYLYADPCAHYIIKLLGTRRESRAGNHDI